MVTDEADLFFDNSQHVTSGQDQVFLATVFNFGSAVFGEQDDVAFGNVDGDAFAIIGYAARANSYDFPFLWFFLCSIGNDKARSSGLFGGQWFNYDAVLKRLDGDSHESLLLMQKVNILLMPGKPPVVAGAGWLEPTGLALARRGCHIPTVLPH